MKLANWPLVGGMLHLVQRGGDLAGSSPSGPILAVPDVTLTTHPSMASVPITVLLYNGSLLSGFYRAMRCISAVFAVMQCPSVRQFVLPSVRHVRVSRQNE